MKQLSRLLLKKTLATLLIPIMVGMVSETAMAQCSFTPSFTQPSSYICTGTTVQFTNTTSGTVTNYGWFVNTNQVSDQANYSNFFNIPGPYVITLIESIELPTDTCKDTVQSAVWVSPRMTATHTKVDPTCFNGTNGSIDLTPAGGTPNICMDNVLANNNYTAANTVSSAGYSGGITLEAWVQPRSTRMTGIGTVMAFDDSTNSISRFSVIYNAQTQAFGYIDGSSTPQYFTGSQARGSWHHIAVTISSTHEVKMYLNGTLNRTITSTSGWIPQLGDEFSIGRKFIAGLSLLYFDGYLDEVRVWNTVLDAPTIASNRNSCMGINNTHPNWGSIVAYYSMNEGTGSYLFDRSGKNNHGTRVGGNTYGTPAQTNWGCFSGGKGYGYSWSNGATTEDLSGIGAGTYTVTIMDGAGAGCNLTQSVTLANPSPVVVTLNPANPAPVCAGQSTTLTASGASTYAWSPATGLSGTTGAAVTATPSSTTTYTCTGTDGIGCTGTSTVQVTVNPLPTVTITGTSTICAGQSTTLTAAGGTSYIWNNGPTTAINTVSPTTTTTYTVTVTDANGCQNTRSVTVTVNPLPTVTITGTSILCAGQSTTLTAGGGTSYIWSNGPTTNTNTVSPTANTTYTVTATNANGCQNTGNVTVTVNPLPTVTFTGPNTICAGQSTTLTAAGGTSYAWSNGPTAAINTVSPAATTTYTVTVTDANVCQNTGNVTVTVNPVPVATITGAGTAICAGEPTTLTAGGGGTYAWSNGAATAEITVSPSVTTTYTVTVTNSFNCTDTEAMTVTVNPLPTVSFTGNTIICTGETTTVTAEGGTSYIWSNGSTTNTNTVSPTTTTTYTVTVRDGNGCENTGSVTVTANPLPTVTFTGDTTICTGDSTIVTAAGGTDYTWSNGATTAENTVSPSETTTYTVTVTDGNGCENTGSVTVTVNPVPTVSIMLMGADTICAGDTTTLMGDGALTYSWSSGDLTQTITVSPTADEQYVLTGMDENGCTDEDFLSIVVNALPVVTFTGTDTICPGDSTSFTVDGGISYSWSSGDSVSTVSLAPSVTTEYTVTVTNEEGCHTVAPFTVTVDPGFNIMISGHDICIGDSVRLSVGGAVSYLWSTGDTTDTLWVAPDSTEDYSVIGTGSNGCEDTDTLTVSVFEVASTPTITQNGNMLSTNVGYVNYQWYLEGTAIPDATSVTYDATESGNYTVNVGNAPNCEAASEPYSFTYVGIGNARFDSFGLQVFPNPNGGQFIVQLGLERDRKVNLYIFDIVGKQVWSDRGDLTQGEWKQNVDLSDFPKGTYLLDVVSEGQRVVKRVVVQ